MWRFVIGLFVIAVCFGSWSIWHFYQKFNSTTVEAATEKFQVTEEMRNELRLALEKSELSADDEAISLWAIDHCQVVAAESRKYDQDSDDQHFWEITRNMYALVAYIPNYPSINVVVGQVDFNSKTLFPCYVVYYGSDSIGNLLRISPYGTCEKLNGGWSSCTDKEVVAKVKNEILDIITPTE